MTSLVDVDRVMEELVAETGLHDFGDPSFRDGLDVFVAAASGEANLNPIGEASAAGQVRQGLMTRLLVQDWYAGHPALEAERIERPLFIVGMSRSGTTALRCGAEVIWPLELREISGAASVRAGRSDR